ncbi:MAG: hypothetical protein RL621_916 [Bacteroidota bacterium]|jgi:hypothetical protein
MEQYQNFSLNQKLEKIPTTRIKNQKQCSTWNTL